MQTCWYKKLIERVRKTSYYNMMMIDGETRNGVCIEIIVDIVFGLCTAICRYCFVKLFFYFFC